MQKKLFLTLSLSVAFVFQVQAQATWAFAKPTDGSGSAGPENSRAICTDASGNTYVVGNFNGSGVSTDFDLDAGPTNLATANTTDGYIVSYDKFGVFRWKTIISGTASDFNTPSGGVCTDGTNVWVSGSAGMTGAPTISSSSNTITISTVGAGVDAFIAKLNCSNGFVQWAQAFGGTGANDFGEGICLDPSGNCYMVGAYSGAFTLNGITAPAPGGTSDAFIAKFNPSGTLIALATGGAITNNDMISNGGGICYVPSVPCIVAVGSAGAATANYGSFTGLANTGLNDCVLLELDLNLNFTNALVFGSTAADDLTGAVYDQSSGGVFVAGYSSGNITFPGNAALTPLGANDIIFARYSPSANNFVWSQIAGGTGNDRGWGVASDNLGGVFLSGHYASPTCSFGGTVSIGSNAGLNDLFVTRYNASGTPIWAVSGGGTGSDDARSIASYVQAVPYQQIIFTTGLYTGAAATIASTILTNDGGSDFYLARIHDPIISCQSPTLNLLGQTNVLCNGGSTGSATVIASGGSPFTYTWSPSGGNAATATGLSVGIYTCVTTNSCGTTASRTVQITQPASALSTATAVTHVLCNGGSSGSATVTSSGGTAPYTYLWSTAQTTSVITGLNAGVRTVTVTDANGCTSVKSITITQPATAVSTSTAVTNVLCNGGNNGSATVTASGGTPGYTYLWSSAQTTSVITGLNAGVRTVTVTDANGCTSIKSITISQPATAVSTSTAVTNVLCNGGSNGSATVTASGGTGVFTYLWSTAATTSVISGQTSGVKTVTVTDANGCTSVNSVNITQPATALSTSTTVTNVLCFGGSTGSATVTASGGTSSYTYLWSTSATTSVITGQTSGVKTVTVTDANGCTSVKSVNITQPATGVSSSTAAANVSCNGGANGSATVTASGGTGGYTYIWSTSATTSVITGQTSGIKTVTVTDANGCTSVNSVNITQPATALNTSTAITNALCNGGTGGATITATGGTAGYTYLWSTSATTSVITSVLAGVYTATVTDSNGCTSIKSVSITQPTALSTATAITNVLCNGGNGSATITASGGTAGYTYLWSTAATTSVISSVPAGVYTATVTDANGCTSIKSVSISQPSAITASVVSTTSPGCGLNNGAITVNASGGTGSLSYSWSPSGGLSSTTSGIGAGSYTCIITDANNCSSTISQSLSNPNSPSVSATVVNAGCTGQTNGVITLTVTGGTPSYSFNWSPSVSTTSIATNLGSGVYNATVTDANNCQTTQSFSITSFPLPTVIGSGPATACPGTTICLTHSGALSYQWTGPCGFSSLSSAPPCFNISVGCGGVFTVSGTDINGCSNSATINVVVHPYASATAVTSASLICTLPTQQSATLSATGALSYTWSPGGTGSSIVVSPTVTTTYIVVGTLGNGCVQGLGAITQSVSACTAVSELQMRDAELMVFPNPTDDFITLIVPTTDSTFEVFNSLGEKLVLSGKLRGESIEISLVDQPSGIYFIRVGSLTKKVIKR